MALFGSRERRYARKLAHMWHVPFRVMELCGRHSVRLEILDTPYRLLPLVHISKLKQVKIFPYRSKNQLNVEEADGLDFDEAVLPEESWKHPLNKDKFEVEKTMVVRSGRNSRFERNQRQYLVQSKGSGDPKWIDKEGLHFGILLQEFDRD